MDVNQPRRGHLSESRFPRRHAIARDYRRSERCPARRARRGRRRWSLNRAYATRTHKRQSARVRVIRRLRSYTVLAKIYRNSRGGRSGLFSPRVRVRTTHLHVSVCPRDGLVTVTGIIEQLRDRISAAAYRRRATAPIHPRRACVDFWGHTPYMCARLGSFHRAWAFSAPAVPMRVYLPVPGH